MKIHKPSETVIYVSALYEIEGSPSIETQIKQLKSLIQPTSTWAIFCYDAKVVEAFSTYPNCILGQVDLPEFQAFQMNSDSILPQHANPNKDTREYIQLSCAKSEMIVRISKILPAAFYVWVSYDILSLSSDTTIFLRNLETIYTKASNQKILIPGCIHRHQIQHDALFSMPIWRFCSNIFVVPKDCVSTFHAEVSEQLTICKQLKKITWDFNLYSLVEHQNATLFQWYLADHNDSIVSPPSMSTSRRIILISMIKNESKIIKRLLNSVLGFVDAICISDTGSTDDTLQILSELYPTFSIPCKTYQHEWKDFGHNRTLSFKDAVDFCTSLGWNLDETYGLLLDGDMMLRVFPSFSKQDLVSIGYRVIQKAGYLEFPNTRFVRLSHPWKCTGVTHEYWDGGNTDFISPDKLHIQDIGDGGCKSDKFERDIRLLEKGLLDSPNNQRYLFYLAQSYKDNKQLDKAIEYYKKRIDAGGWFEEIWYSMYVIMQLYAEKKQYAEMEYWGLKAFEYRKERAENILFLCRHFRETCQYYKAWQYWLLGSKIPKPNDLLFIETDCYTKGFASECVILHDYVFPERKQQSLEIATKYFNQWNEHWSYMNFEWFVQKIPSKVQPLLFPRNGDFGPTSISICRQSDESYIVNVRYVNYRIEPTGRYIMCLNGDWNYNHPVRTENYVCFMNKDFSIYSPLIQMNILDVPTFQGHIQGLEDVRIFLHEGNFHYSATTKNFSYDGNIRQHTGEYCIYTQTFKNNISLKPPMPTDCEKNWIPYKGNKFIYGWHPFRIGSIGPENTLQIESSQTTPPLLQHMRGSSTLVEDGEFAWGITHCVIYKQPRKYYHMVVKIDLATDRLIGYTLPFFFVNNAIEYCLGFEKRGDTLYAFVSQNDSDPILVEFSMNNLVWQTIS